ncbi:MAG: nuclear transport factor 2 family protein [Firmicutes bacterium]|nr:nuclear transport factor 2 family protein [Bacillota bacterium]
MKKCLAIVLAFILTMGIAGTAFCADKQELSLKDQVQKLSDVHRIQNVMGTMMYMFEAGKHEDMLENFAEKTPGVTVEIANWGVFEGREGARKMIVDAWKQFEKNNAQEMKKAFPKINNDRAGLLDLNALACPVIEVAGDGKTAKGLWLAPGLQTQFNPGLNKPEGNWAWLKFAVDFVKENGKWKIWHYHLCPMFRTAYDKSWVDSSIDREQALASGNTPPPPSNGPQPDKPTSSYHAYSVTEAPAYDPQPPVPYYTFRETFSY